MRVLFCEFGDVKGFSGKWGVDEGCGIQFPDLRKYDGVDLYRSRGIRGGAS